MTQLQQELLTLRVEVAAESGLADAVRAINSLATAQVRKDMMLEWAAEQATEITTTAVDLEFLPTDTNEDRGVQKPGVCVAADAHSTHGSHEL